MDNVHIVTLGCHHCHGEHLHEVTYAGRLRRVIHHPVSFARGLPGALLTKPAKLEAELRVLSGRR
jgi:hypothetical protein